LLTEATSQRFPLLPLSLKQLKLWQNEKDSRVSSSRIEVMLSSMTPIGLQEWTANKMTKMIKKTVKKMETANQHKKKKTNKMMELQSKMLTKKKSMNHWLKLTKRRPIQQSNQTMNKIKRMIWTKTMKKHGIIKSQKNSKN
jgi:hypothetical protein